jgi:hypothetical protein
MQADFPSLLLASLAIWPLFQTANFTRVPLRHQLLAVNGMTLLDASFLSWCPLPPAHVARTHLAPPHPTWLLCCAAAAADTYHAAAAAGHATRRTGSPLSRERFGGSRGRWRVVPLSPRHAARTRHIGTWCGTAVIDGGRACQPLNMLRCGQTPALDGRSR